MIEYTSSIVQEDMKELFLREELPSQQLNNKRILITGASGMLASYLMFYLIYLNENEGYSINITALVRNRKKLEACVGEIVRRDYFHILEQDVCHPISYDEEFDYIIHAAGNASPTAIVKDPVGIITANTVGTINVCDLAAKNRNSKVMYLSTREVYGKCDGESDLNEKVFGALDPSEPRSCYPESKRMSESILESYRQQYGISYTTVRIAHSFGPGMAIDNDGRVMADFISDAVHGRSIVLKSAGTAIRAFCYITDAVSGILIALLKGADGEAYNLANETEPMEIREVAGVISGLFPDRCPEVIFDIPEAMGKGYSKMGRVPLNTQKIEKLGWMPRISLRTGIRQTVEGYVNNKQN